jgi:hypothetical protein
VEDALRIQVPAEAGPARAILLELERFQQRAAEVDALLALLDALVRTATPGAVSGWPGGDATPQPPLPGRAWASSRGGAAPSCTASRSVPTTG